MGVEPTILAAKDRINGFEGHEDHRTPFASVADSITGMRVNIGDGFEEKNRRLALFVFPKNQALANGLTRLRARSRSLEFVQTS